MTDVKTVARRIVLIVVILSTTIGAVWTYLAFSRWLALRPVRAFHAEVDTLFEALHKYKQHVGEYPRGSNREIAQALVGNNARKIIILAVRHEHINAKGEIVDPWGTPLKIYCAEREVLIRSAGPNKTFEDSKRKEGDDYFRSD